MMPAAPSPKIAPARPIADLSWAAKLARAKRTYNRTWREAAHLFGASPLSAPPPVEWLQDFTNDQVSYTDPRKVTLSIPAVESLDHTLRDPTVLAEGKGLLLHEWAHIYQNRGLAANPNLKLREDAAQLFATYWAHKLWGASAMSREGAPPYSDRPAASIELAAAYGPDYWRHAQFSEHWGQAPAAIGWP